MVRILISVAFERICLFGRMRVCVGESYSDLSAKLWDTYLRPVAY